MRQDISHNEKFCCNAPAASFAMRNAIFDAKSSDPTHPFRGKRFLRKAAAHAMLKSIHRRPFRGNAVNETRSNDTPVAGTLTMLDRLDATHEQMRYWLRELQTPLNHIEDRR